MDAVFVLHFLLIYQRIVEDCLISSSHQVDVEVSHLGISDIITVWLEREAQDEHFGIRGLELSEVAGALDLTSHPYRHLLVHLACSREERRNHVYLLCLIDEIVWIYSDTVTANDETEKWLWLSSGKYFDLYG